MRVALDCAFSSIWMGSTRVWRLRFESSAEQSGVRMVACLALHDRVSASVRMRVTDFEEVTRSSCLFELNSSLRGVSYRVALVDTWAHDPHRRAALSLSSRVPAVQPARSDSAHSRAHTIVAHTESFSVS